MSSSCYKWWTKMTSRVSFVLSILDFVFDMQYNISITDDDSKALSQKKIVSCKSSPLPTTVVSHSWKAWESFWALADIKYRIWENEKMQLRENLKFTMNTNSCEYTNLIHYYSFSLTRLLLFDNNLKKLLHCKLRVLSKCTHLEY